jgi:Domain of unknown function (DUF4136)
MMNWRSVFVPLAAFALIGCASTPSLTADVQSFAQWPAVPAATSYKFERTPSQSAGQAAEAQAKLEAAAKPVLAKLGWQESKDANAAATHSVSLQWRAVKVDDPNNPWYGFGTGFGGRDYVVTRSGHVVWLPTGPRMDWPITQREFQVIVRDLKTQAVVYESTAKNESRSGADAEIATLLASAALDGFPTPAPGARQVRR